MGTKFLLRWACGLALAAAPLGSGARAAETGTVTLTGTFHPDELSGTVGADLAAVYAGGGEHTWTLTLHGASATHPTYSAQGKFTDIAATSFELVFEGPDAATLNAVVAGPLAGGSVTMQLRNHDTGGTWSDMALWLVPPEGGDAGVSFFAGHELIPNSGLFPSDADGYPVVPAEPFTFRVEETVLVDNRPGNGGSVWSWEDQVTMSGSVGDPPPPPPAPPPAPATLSVADAAVAEPDKGSRKASVRISLSAPTDHAVTVRWRTADGSAVAGADYNAAGGTVTIKAGQTSKSVSVSVKGDKTAEPDETLSVEIYDASGAAIADGTAVVTILNDD